MIFIPLFFFIIASIVFVELNKLISMITYILLFFSGIGVFLYGLTMVSKNAMDFGEKLISTKMRKFLLNPFFSTTMGLSITTIVQSSTATNSFAVKLADEKMVDTKTSIYFIMGSNIGTTVTAYLAILAKLNFSYIIASMILPAIFVYMLVKNKQIKNTALILCCLSLIFIGLILVNNAMVPIQDKIYYFMVYQRNDITLFAFALLLTALLQSSSLTSVLLISMSSVAVIDIQTAIIMVMGINIGSCFSVILASIGCSKTGWAVALFHLFFNIIGSLINLFMLKMGLLSFLTNFNSRIDIKIALFHTFFNAITTLFLFYYIPEISRFLDRFSKKQAKITTIFLPLLFK